jgi:hypothetical protein
MEVAVRVIVKDIFRRRGWLRGIVSIQRSV